MFALMEERVKLYLKKKEEDKEDELILAIFFYFNYSFKIHNQLSMSHLQIFYIKQRR